MLQIGQRNKKLLPKVEEFIDPSFFKISFSIRGKIFRKAVDGILSFEEEDLDQLSDASLDKALDECSYYRFTFLAAGVEIEERIIQLERIFKTWYAEVSEEIKLKIIRSRRQLKTNEDVPASWFGSITKQEIESGILTDKNYGPKYAEHEDLIAKMNKTKKILFGLRDILHDRGGHLQSIGRRKLENRKMDFGVRNN